jgi:hypothetical protein
MKCPQNSPTCFIERHFKIYPNWNFWCENIPSGNTATVYIVFAVEKKRFITPETVFQKIEENKISGKIGSGRIWHQEDQITLRKNGQNLSRTLYVKFST